MCGVWAEPLWPREIHGKEAHSCPPFWSPHLDLPKPHPSCICIAMKNRYFLSWITLHTLGPCLTGVCQASLGKDGHGWAWAEHGGGRACGLWARQVTANVCLWIWTWSLRVLLKISQERKAASWVSAVRGPALQQTAVRYRRGAIRGSPPLLWVSPLLCNAFLTSWAARLAWAAAAHWLPSENRRGPWVKGFLLSKFSFSAEDDGPQQLNLVNNN